MRTFPIVYGIGDGMIIDDESFDYHHFTGIGLRVGSALLAFIVFVGVISNV